MSRNVETIPLVDLKAQYHEISHEIDRAIQRVLESTSFIMGPEVEQFEEAFAAFCDMAYCVGVASGTAALELALRACDIGPGDEVITTAHTFIATAEAISAVGAKPVFVDIDPRTYTLDPDQLTPAITARTRAVVPVHIYGQPADMTRISAVARAHGLVVIADAAQAHGAEWNNSRAAALGDVACFSFYPGKNLGAYGDAGAMVTNASDIAERVRLLRNHGRRSKYVHKVRGFGERLDTLQAAILHTKLGHLPRWTLARQALARQYRTLLHDTDLILPFEAEAAKSAWHLYVIRIEARDALLDHLRSEHIGAGVHYPLPLHLQPAYADLGYRRGRLPVTELVADTCVSLPLYPEMRPSQQVRVAEAVVQFARHYVPAV